MKKVLSVLLTLAVLAGLAFGGQWLLCRSPRGVYNPDGAAETMQSILSGQSTGDWRELLRPLWKGEVSEFEDRDEVFNDLFDAAVSGSEFRFAENSEKSSVQEAVYLLCAGDRALAELTLRWEDGAWQWVGTAMDETMLPGERRTLSLTVPAGAAVTVNSLPVDPRYAAEELDYEDITDLEKRFENVPTLVRYEIPGLYRNADVAAEGQVLLSSDGEAYRFAPPEGNSHSFRVLAPEDCSVTVNGALLTREDSSDRIPMPVSVDVPEELQNFLPTSLLYAFDGLYSVPEITVTDPGGLPLTGELRSDGTVVYAHIIDAAPEEELSAMVENYMNAVCRFGVSLAYLDTINMYVDWNSELGQFYQLAQPSLGWILGTGLDIHKIWSDSYITLGNDACLCSAHCQCATTNYYRTDELDLCYRLLCVRTQNGWRVQDMAYD